MHLVHFFLDLAKKRYIIVFNMNTKLLKGILVAFIILFSTPASASGWKVYIMGVDLDLIKERDWAMIGLGVGSSLLAHKIGHIGYLSLSNKHFSVKGDRVFYSSRYIYHEKLAPEESRRYARAGFAFQSLIGLALTGFKATRESNFTKGFILMTDLELALYHQYHKDWGDFSTIETNGGNMARDYNAFCAIAIYNTARAW